LLDGGALLCNIGMHNVTQYRRADVDPYNITLAEASRYGGVV